MSLGVRIKMTRKVCEIRFSFDELAFAEFDSDSPKVSPVLDQLLRRAPAFERCMHHGIYNYDCSIGSDNTVRVQKSGLLVIMHDGECFDQHPLLDYLQSEMYALFPDAQFIMS